MVSVGIKLTAAIQLVKPNKPTALTTNTKSPGAATVEFPLLFQCFEHTKDLEVIRPCLC